MCGNAAGERAGLLPNRTHGPKRDSQLATHRKLLMFMIKAHGHRHLCATPSLTGHQIPPVLMKALEIKLSGVSGQHGSLTSPEFGFGLLWSVFLWK